MNEIHKQFEKKAGSQKRGNGREMGNRRPENGKRVAQNSVIQSFSNSVIQLHTETEH